jgi:hypothetical protein
MEGVGYWVFIAVLFLLSSLMKKRQQKAAREKLDDDFESSDNEPEGKININFLQDIYKEFQGLTEDELVESKEDLDEEEIEEEWTEPAPKTVESMDQVGVVFDDISNPVSGRRYKRTISGIKVSTKTAFGKNMFRNLNDLKRAVIYKEILDKPRAMRRSIR